MTSKYDGPKNAMPQMSLFGAGTKPAHEHNYFFALSPTAEVRQQLADVGEQLNSIHKFNGSWVSSERFHLTLHHLGQFQEVRPDRVAKAITAANKIQAKPFGVVLDQFMCFDSRTGRFPCVITSENELPQLKFFWQLLKNNLLAVKLGDKLNNSFKPHATLLYNRQPLAETYPVTPIRWRVNDFVLIESLVGKSTHIELGRWPLTE
ncbi:MAG: 2'-5' RNA ligase family protein [Arenimonas sp.]